MKTPGHFSAAINTSALRIFSSHRFGKIELSTVAATAIFVPIVIIAHELGHFLIGIMVGVPNPEIGLSGFKHGPAPWIPAWQTASIGFAGPAVSLALALAWLTLKRPISKRIASVVGFAACMRLCEILPYALIGIIRWASGAPYRRTTFDESRVFEILGLNGDIGLVVFSISFGAIIAMILRHQSAASAKSLILGGLIGWSTWRILLAMGIIS